MNTPNFSDVEIILPEGWMQTSHVAALAMRYVHSKIDQALQDAIQLIVQEAIKRPAMFVAELFGADEATKRTGAPPRDNIKDKALELLRRRHESVSFRNSRCEEKRQGEKGKLNGMFLCHSACPH